MRSEAPTDDAPEKGSVESISPVLDVRDVDASIAYYRDVLGFSEADALRAPDGKPVHGMARQGPVMFQFTPANGSHTSSKPGAGVTFYVQVGGSDIDAYYARVKASGAQVVDEIQTQFWGDRTFTVADPDGYRVMFAKQVQNVSIEEMQKALQQ
jgi:PhnB protein